LEDFISSFFLDGKKIEEPKPALAAKKEIIKYTDTFKIFKVDQKCKIKKELSN